MKPVDSTPYVSYPREPKFLPMSRGQFIRALAKGIGGVRLALGIAVLLLVAVLSEHFTALPYLSILVSLPIGWVVISHIALTYANLLFDNADARALSATTQADVDRLLSRGGDGGDS